MENFSTKDLAKELYSRGQYVFDPKEIACETFWSIDDAIDALIDLNRNTMQLDTQLPHEVLMEILHDTLVSDVVQKFIYNKLKDNIQEYIEA